MTEILSLPHDDRGKDEYTSFTPEQMTVRQAFLGRVALENSLDWGAPGHMESSDVTQRFDDLSEWLWPGMVQAKPALGGTMPYDAEDFLGYMKQGYNRAHFIDQGMKLCIYKRHVEVLYRCVSAALESYRSQSAKRFASFDVVTDDGRLARLLETEAKKRHAAIVLAFENGWSAEEAEAAFISRQALWRPRKAKSPKPKKLMIRRDEPTSETTKQAEPPELPDNEPGDEGDQYLYPRQKKRRIPVLKAEREVELAKTIEVGTFAEKLMQDLQPDQTIIKVGEHNVSKRELFRLIHDRDEAILEFATNNRGLVRKKVREMWDEVTFNSRLPTDRDSLAELIDEVLWDDRRGIAHAIHKFDFTQGVKFSTYANDWIMNGLYEALGARLPMPMKGYRYQVLMQLRAAIWRVQSIDSAERTPEQRALLENGDPALAVAAAEVDYLTKHPSLYPALRPALRYSYKSIHDIFGSGNGMNQADTYENVVADQGVRDVAEQATTNLVVDQAFKELTGREELIVRHFFGIDKIRLDAEDLCSRYGWKPQDERKWRRLALEKIRPHMTVLLSDEIPAS